MPVNASIADLSNLDKVLLRELEAVEAEIARQRFIDYTTFTFNYRVKDKDKHYQVNWHHELIAEEIDLWLNADDPYNLIIQVPPRHGKSELCSRRLAGYIFGQRPDAEIILASYASTLASTMSRDAQRIMLSDGYRKVFPNTRLMTTGMKKVETAIRRNDEFSVINLESHQVEGNFLATGREGMTTGRGADCLDGETLVQTSKGVKKIKNIKTNDMVLSLGEGLCYSKVLAKRKIKAKVLYEITSGSNVIRATGDHPIFVYNKGYTEAKSLRIGDKTISLKQEVYRLQSPKQRNGQPNNSMCSLPYGSPSIEQNTVSSIIAIEQEADVFDIQVENTHNFFANGILVHNCGIIDDPFKNRAEAESETIRESVIEWYKSTFRTRLEKGGRILMLLTRWHLYDLAGWCINKMKSDPDADTWKVISLPAIYQKGEYTHPKDPRKEGEALWPDKYDEKSLKKIKASIGGYDWLALYQQQPAPPGGAVIKREWLKVIEPSEVPANIHWIRYWDLAVTAKTSADHTASVQVGVDKYGNIYVRRIIWEQESWPVIKSMLKVIGIQERLPVGIEAVGTQKGFVQDLHTDPELMNVPIYEFDEDTDKLTRALPWIAKAEAGKFYIVRGKNVDTYIDELVEFTGKGDNADDQVDATSGAYRMLAEYIEPEIEVVGEYGEYG